MSGVFDRLNGVLSAPLGPRLAEAGLAVLLGVLLMLGLLSLFAPLPTPKGDALAALTAAPQRSSVTLDVTSPFPKSQAPLAPVELAPDVAETSLDLELKGVWANGERSSATIRTPDGKQGRFVIGDEIVNGVRMVGVFGDRVIIEQRGVRESLRFEGKVAIDPSARPAARAAAADAPRTTGAGQQFSIETLQTIFRLGPGADAAGAPAIIIRAGSDRAKFAQTGLRDGDVLRAINGGPPPLDPAELTRLLSEITRVGSARVVVERGGERKSVTVSLSELGNG